MAPKKTTSSGSSSSSSSAASSGFPANWATSTFDTMWNHYQKTTSHQTKLIDIFLLFLVAVGALQFLYYLVLARDPFNAFLAGFIANVGQFVLAVSLRMQTDPQNKAEFPKVTPERSFADFIFGSLILHFFCVNYLN